MLLCFILIIGAAGLTWFKQTAISDGLVFPGSGLSGVWWEKEKFTEKKNA
jgi:hypothetical protein